jgi:hypothetical protein
VSVPPKVVTLVYSSQEEGMKMNGYRQSCVFFCIVVLMGIGYLLSAEGMVSRDFILASFEAQEDASVPGIVIEYMAYVRSNNGEKKLFSKNAYVRTHRFRFRESEFYHEGNPVMVCQDQYDRELNNYKSLTINKKTGEPGGEFGEGMPVSLPGTDTLDPIHFGIYETTLFDLVKSGRLKVSQDQEQINDAMCYTLTGTHLNDNAHVRVWLDPRVGLCPRQIKTESHFPGVQKSVCLVHFQQYKEIAKGVWIPYYVKVQLMVDNLETGVKTNVENILEVQRAYATRPIRKGAISVEFLPGTQVYDANADITMRIP